MNILLLTGTYLPSRNGIAQVVAEQKKRMEEAGHTVIILAPKHPDLTSEEPQVFRYPSLPNPMSPDDPLPLLPLTRTVSKLVRHYKIELIHSHIPFHLGQMASQVARKHKVPLIMTMHTNFEEYIKQPDQFLKLVPKQLRRYFVQKTAYQTYRKANLVICLSKFMALNLKKRYPSLPIIIIPTGCPSLTLPKLRSKTRQELKVTNQETLLIYTGRVSPEKNLGDLITTLSLLPKHFKLLIVGDGPEKDKLEDQIKELKLKKRVIWTGFVSHEEISRYYEAADIFVSTSVTENQPLTFIEAASTGLPLFVYQSDAATEWVPEGIGERTKPSPQALALALSQLPDKSRIKMAKEAKTFAEKFDSSKTSKEIMDIFTKLLKTPVKKWKSSVLPVVQSL